MALTMFVALAFAAQAAAGAAPTSTTAATCAAPAALEPAFAGWRTRTPLRTATRGAGPSIAVGKAYDLALSPGAALRMSNLPGPVGDRIGYGGIVSFTVPRAGLYRVALGSGAWVDLVRDEKAVESVGHGHGPDCSGIAKVVDFRLVPGRYRLTLDGNDADSASVLVAPAP